MKNLMLLFGVTLAKRFTNSQKRIFYTQIEPFFKKLGYKFEFRESGKSLSRITNLLIGDISSAQYIVVCPYDTPSRSLIPYKYYPFKWSENLRQENKELFLRSIIFIIICVFAYISLNYFSNLTSFLMILAIISLSALLFFCYKLIAGFANPINFNRNSASIALIAALAEKAAANKNVGFVLLDKNTSTNAGLKALAEEKRLKNKICLYLDCVSDGEKLVIAHQTAANPEAEKLITLLKEIDLVDFIIKRDQLGDTNIQFFPKMLHICTGTFEGKEFLVRNTRSRRDMKVNIPKLEKLRDGLLNYIQG